MESFLIYLPKPLKSGHTIGLICPSGGFIDYKPIKLVTNYLKTLGYKVKVGESLIASKKAYKYLSGSDQERLNDLTKMWLDDSVDAVFCLRGGYGSTRILPMINYEIFKNNHKLLIGYSDITALLLSIYSKSGLVTFHGPMLGIKTLNEKLVPKNKRSVSSIWKVLKDKDFSISYKVKGISTVYPGKASGILLGGNLSVICSMLGSKFLPNFNKSILFIEDCNEEPYKIDRMLTQLKNAGVFEQISGLVVGSFYKCKFKNKNEVINLIKDRLGKNKIPTIYNFPCGHGKNNFTLPVGMKVLIDSKAHTLNTL